MQQILDFEKEIFALENQIQELISLSHMYDSVGDISDEITKLKKKLRHMKHDVFANLKNDSIRFVSKDQEVIARR